MQAIRFTLEWHWHWPHWNDIPMHPFNAHSIPFQCWHLNAGHWVYIGMALALAALELDSNASIQCAFNPVPMRGTVSSSDSEVEAEVSGEALKRADGGDAVVSEGGSAGATGK